MPDLKILSERELEILQLLAEGKSNKDIAQDLFISTNTVKVHLRNIFSKLEVSSRTEAVLYILRATEPPAPNEIMADSPAAEEEDASPLPGEPLDLDFNPKVSIELDSPATKPVSRKIFPRVLTISILALLGIIILISTGVGLARYFQPTPTPSPETVDTAASPTNRWQFKKELPLPRSGLAAVVYEEQIYIIGGENTEVLPDLLRYDPLVDSWEALPPKPNPVTDIQAAVAGGKIFVPGGRLANGQPTDVLEIYNPREGIWTQGASLPTPLSAYALVAFEGDLFLFGGWDGEEYTHLTLKYDLGQDQWRVLTPLPDARGFAGAAVVGGKIHLVGGFDGINFLPNNDIYSPEFEGTAQSPWEEGAPLPEGRSAMGIANMVDNIYIIGGESLNEEFFSQLKYSPSNNIWEVTTNPLAEPWANMGVVPFGTSLYAMGGKLNNQPSKRNLVYQVIYSISIPLSP